MENIQIVQIDFKDIEKISFIYDTSYQLTVHWNDVKYEFLINLKSNSDKLFFFGNGAYDNTKMSLPIFQRHSWVNDISESVIIYNDPTLYLGDINLGWGQGTKKRFYLKDLSTIIEKFISILEMKNSDVTFYGSSAGGYLSLYLAGFIKGAKALVNNPQTAVFRYYPSHVRKMYSFSYANLDDDYIKKEYKARLDLISFYKKIKYVPEFLYLQNLACEHDVKNHLIPFINGLNEIVPNTKSSKIKFEFYYNEEQGHNPLGKKETIDYLQKFTHVKNNSIEIKPIDLNKIIKITQVNSNTVEIAEMIMNNKIYIYSSLDVIDFEDKINWDYQHHSNAKTYQLYLQALNCISYLLNAVEKSNNVKYLIKALEIIESWYAYQSKNPPNDMVWYDHPTAYRAHNLVYFLVVAEKFNLQIDKEKYISLIEKHVQYLYSDTSYRKNNHGIMMDRSLILLGLVLEHPEADRWIEKGIWRLKDTFYNSYSFKGVHLENSPEYHRIVFNLYKSTEKFLNDNNLSLGEDILNTLAKSEEYFSYISKPDGSLPMIGDTGKSFTNVPKKFDSFHDQTAGITVMQAENKDNEKLSTWISFVCGYATTTHKHFDDLSLNLFYKGKDIFVDSGKYGYGSSKFRAYVRSSDAHSSLGVKNKQYKITMANSKNIFTTGFYTSEKFDMVKGINLGYPGMKLQRVLIFIKPDILVILDSFDSNTKSKFKQIFNLAPHIEMADYRKSKTTLKSDNEIIEIEQLNAVDELNVFHGDENLPRAIISEKFGKVIKTNQLEYILEKEKGYFTTVIKMGEDAILKFKKISVDENKKFVAIDLIDETISLYF